MPGRLIGVLRQCQHSFYDALEITPRISVNYLLDLLGRGSGERGNCAVVITRNIVADRAKGFLEGESEVVRLSGLGGCLQYLFVFYASECIHFGHVKLTNALSTSLRNPFLDKSCSQIGAPK